MPAASDSSSVQKVCRILRALSTPQPQRLADVCASTGLHKATALRLLEALAQEGFVERNAATKRFALGDESLVLGLAMQSRDHVSKRARPWLVRLASQSGDTIILSTRHGNESVCIDREFGTYPIRANYLDIGSRRPLGVGAGSMALLAWLPEQEAAVVLDEIRPALATRYPRIDRALLEDEIRLARTRGHSLLLDVVVERMGGIGVPIFGSDGTPTAAISLAALNERITSRLDQLVPALQEAAAALSAHRPQGDCMNIKDRP
jgi:DNA-binding IclR family transcriptional regulator